MDGEVDGEVDGVQEEGMYAAGGSEAKRTRLIMTQCDSTSEYEYELLLVLVDLSRCLLN